MGRGLVARALALSLAVVALGAAGPVSIARADGDPASDYLVANQVFLTAQSVTSTPAERRLLALVRAANRDGFAIRVALVSSDYDLGSITALWRKPQIYARFLGLELSGAYRQRLLVVMPNGFGFNWPGHAAATAAAFRTLEGVAPGGASADLAPAATAALRRLAAAAGVTLPTGVTVPAGGPTRTASGSSAITVAIVVIGVLALAGAAVLIIRRALRRRPQAEGSRPEGEIVSRPEDGVGSRPQGAVRSGRGPAARAYWLIPGLAALAALAIAIPVMALRRSSAPPLSPASTVTPPAFTWPAGSRQAPDFMLRDQLGRPVSIAAYRGRPVIVTFVDPLCRNLCPLEAQVLNQTVRQMAPGQRPAIVAVSVDVYADTRADLLQDVGEWHLVPQWRWAVGSPAKLAAVWSRYAIGVQVTTKHISGTTINYILHTEAAYLIDASGHERALFVWPFYPQDVKRVLHQLA